MKNLTKKVCLAVAAIVVVISLTSFAAWPPVCFPGDPCPTVVK